MAKENMYQQKYSQSIKSNDEFWRKEGKRITWIKPYKKIKDVKYSTEEVKINKTIAKRKNGHSKSNFGEVVCKKFFDYLLDHLQPK